ncbi:MAG: hypothetical protein JXQ73_29550 [Phycisphaerae bacterium]|nr:hypothetical protein [Phycisphaerae bacterium]
MGHKCVLTIAALCGMLLTFTGEVRADYWDALNDNELNGSSTGLYNDNPHWVERLVTGTNYALGVDEGRIRVTCQNTFFPFCFLGASCEDDPNDTYYDNTEAHYVVANVKSHEDNWDPNNGMVGLWTHGHFASGWTAYDCEYELNNGWMSLTSYSGFTWLGLDAIQRYHTGYPESLMHPDSPYLDPNNTWDPNDPNYPTETDWKKANIWVKDARVPMWMLIQFDPYGTNHDANNVDDPNDPNCHWIRGAAWTGGKYDWDGTFFLQANCVGDMLGEDVSDPINGDFPFDPIYDMPYYLHQDGWDSVAAFSGGESAQDPNVTGYVVDTSYDDFESRWGYFTNESYSLSLSVINPQYGSVVISPDVLDDPNEAVLWDPNDPNEPPPQAWNLLRRYTDGTPIVMVAEAIAGKSFSRWVIFDPNHPGDANFGTADSNTVLYLTMDEDKSIEAAFKCGSGLPPFVGMMLLGLCVGVVIRRLT